MLIKLQRFKDSGKATLGLLFIDGIYACFTLEDSHHDKKISGQTRIPVGFYRLTLRDSGGMHQKYLNRYPQMHQGMLWIRDIPGFEYVYFHTGNDENDTEGCPLIGTQAIQYNGITQILGSRDAYVRYYPIISTAIKNNKDVFVLIQDENILN